MYREVKILRRLFFCIAEKSRTLIVETATFHPRCVKMLVHTPVWTALCALIGQKFALLKIFDRKANGFMGIFVLFDADGLTLIKEKRTKSTAIYCFEADSDNFIHSTLGGQGR